MLGIKIGSRYTFVDDKDMAPIIMGLHATIQHLHSWIFILQN